MTSPTSDEKIISPDDEDWDWRAGAKICDELKRRCIYLAKLYGSQIRGDRYDYEFFIDNYSIKVGTEESRVKVMAFTEDGWDHSVYSTHAQVGTDWRLIQTTVLPLLRGLMVLDDLAEV